MLLFGRKSHPSSVLCFYLLIPFSLFILKKKKKMMENMITCFFLSFAHKASIRHPLTSPLELILGQNLGLDCFPIEKSSSYRCIGVPNCNMEELTELESIGFVAPH